MDNLEIKWNMWVMWLSCVPQGPQAAVRLLRKSVGLTASAPTTVVTDKWRPTMATVREAFPSAEHGFGKHLNNRAEISAGPASPVRSVKGRAPRPAEYGYSRHPMQRLRGEPSDGGRAGDAGSLLRTRLWRQFPVS